ncbi:hypothetical protein V6Z12_A09G202600 [Gossypium hirsutum]
MAEVSRHNFRPMDVMDYQSSTFHHRKIQSVHGRDQTGE